MTRRQIFSLEDDAGGFAEIGAIPAGSLYKEIFKN